MIVGKMAAVDMIRAMFTAIVPENVQPCLLKPKYTEIMTTDSNLFCLPAPEHTWCVLFKGLLL